MTQKCVKGQFSNNARHITDGFIQAVAVFNQLPTTSQKIVLLDLVLSEKVAAAKARWMFKLAESDLSLSTCNHLSDKFQNMFSDGEIANSFQWLEKSFVHYSEWNLTS